MTEESPFTSQGLLRELANYILKRSDTNPSFAETSASALVATAAGPNVVISDLKGDVHFNIFGIIIGGSAISNKTVALDIVREIITNLSAKLELDLNLPQKFSIEGLSNYLLENTQGLSAGDEYTSMFQAKSKTWLVDSMEFLSTLYDGYVPKYVTIKRGVEYVPHVYVNFLSATTFYLLKLMKTDDFFLQGTGCRFLWDVDTERRKTDVFSEDGAMFFLDPTRRQERDQELYTFVDKLASIHTKIENTAETSLDKILTLSLSWEALGLLSRYRVEKINQAVELFQKDILNPDVGYIARLAENAIKLSGIHCISRFYIDPESSLNLIPEVNEDDVKWAINKVEHHFQMYLKLKEIRDSIHADFSTRGHKTDFQKVLAIIDRNGGYSNITKIMQGTKWLKEPTLKILQAMVISKEIKPVEIKPSHSIRHAVYIRYNAVIPWVEKWRVKQPDR